MTEDYRRSAGLPDDAGNLLLHVTTQPIRLRHMIAPRMVQAVTRWIQAQRSGPEQSDS